jgi:hypothetical protein
MVMVMVMVALFTIYNWGDKIKVVDMVGECTIYGEL